MLEDILNYRQVAPDLAASGQPDEQELAAIAAAGYTTVINIALHDDPRYSLADERGTVEALGMAYVHIPVQFGNPITQDFARFTAAMDAHRGGRLWVHCAANKRVSVFLGLHAHLHRGVPLDEAFALQRDIWEPDAVWTAFIARMIAARHGQHDRKHRTMPG